MARTLKYDMNGPDWRRTREEVAEHGVEAIFAPGFEAPLSLVVEIGFGRGEFIVEQAKRRPDFAFIGIELEFKRVLKLARRISPMPIRNLRLVLGPGEEVVEEIIALDSVDEFWINFPDPWPKVRHARRRMIQSHFVSRLARRLKPGGVLHAATDDRRYAEQMDEVLAADPLLENEYAPLHWRPDIEGRMQTAYEREWRADGRPLQFFAYRRPL